RKGDGLHQGYWLPDYVGTRPQDLPGDEYFGLEVFLGDIFWRVRYGDRHVEMVVLVVVLQLGDQDFLKGLGGKAASSDVTSQWESNFSAGVHHHRAVKLGVLQHRNAQTVAGFKGLRVRGCGPYRQANQNNRDPHLFPLFHTGVSPNRPRAAWHPGQY